MEENLDRPDRGPIKQDIIGVKSLLLEMIRRAAYDWVLYRDSDKPKAKHLANNSYTWLFEEDEDHPDWKERNRSGKHVTSFLGICSALDLNAGMLRDSIRKLTAANIRSVGRPPEYRRHDRYEVPRTGVSLSRGTLDSLIG